VSHFINLDYDQLIRNSETVADGQFQGETETGLLVATEPDCVPDGQQGLVEFGAAPMTVPYGLATGGPCDVVEVPWDELGVPAETIAARGGPNTRAFMMADGATTEIDVPGNAYFNGVIGERITFAENDGDWFELADDDTIVPSTPPAGTIDQSWGAWPIGERDGVTFSSTQLPSEFGSWTDLFGTSTGDDEVAWTNWSQLYGHAAVAPDPFVVEGGREVSGGGLTIRRDSLQAEPEFSLTDSGEVVDVSRVRTDSSNGDIVIVDEAGAELARLGGEAASPVVWGGCCDDATNPPAWYVETSVDGMNVASESLADADISSVPRISTDGTNVIVAVTMKERNADGVPKQLVLVGTPRT
jgi:hypothetical protein